MKNVIYYSALFFFMVLFSACEKNEPITGSSKSDYFYSLKGQKHNNMDVEIYKVESGDNGTCSGVYVKCGNKDFDFLLEIDGELPESLRGRDDLTELKFNIDFVFTGISYNCTKSYKKPGMYGDGSPVEIQQINIARIDLR